MVALLQEGEEGRRYRSHARRKCKRILTAFDLCDSGLECVLSRISQASIKIAGLLVIVNGNTILCVRKCEYRGAIDGYRDSSVVIVRFSPA